MNKNKIYFGFSIVLVLIVILTGCSGSGTIDKAQIRTEVNGFIYELTHIEGTPSERIDQMDSMLTSDFKLYGTDIDGYTHVYNKQEYIDVQIAYYTIGFENIEQNLVNKIIDVQSSTQATATFKLIKLIRYEGQTIRTEALIKLTIIKSSGEWYVQKQESVSISEELVS